MNHIPNVLSFFRILVCPLIVYFYAFNDTKNMLVGLALFGLGSLSDFVDGKIARKYKVESRLGRIIDPIADKLLVFSALMVLYNLDTIYLWLVILIIFRDIAVTLLRFFMVSKSNVISPTKLAKGKTFYQMTVLFILLIWPIFLKLPELSLVSIPNLLLYPAMLLTWITAIPYFKAALQKT